MAFDRDANGNQVPDPSKFPVGFKPVADFIHNLNMSVGLYTAKGPHTCQKRAASCVHEAQDASLWASWGVDYVKDDSCSVCQNFTDLEDYGRMWAAIQSTGRQMVLTVEGDPDVATMSQTGIYGNAKRVGHDISPQWGSMISLVDIGSGLWPWAHNSSNATVGGFWNDLDMVEIGNKPDFQCELDAPSLARCQAHFTMWTIMKAPLILGNNIPAMTQPSLSVLSNAEAIAVSQDALGVQARRVAVNASLPSLLLPGFTLPVAALCNASSPTQNWRLSSTGTLFTRDASGREWCIVDSLGSGEVGSWDAQLCSSVSSTAGAFAVSPSSSSSSSFLLLHSGSSKGALSVENALGASGPAPFTRYIHTAPHAHASSKEWACSKGGGGLKTAAGCSLALSSKEVLADSMTGSVTARGDFCLDLTASTVAEVWVGPLTGGRWSVALLNRSPTTTTITLTWSMFNASSSASYSVRSIWDAKDEGSFQGAYSASVPSISTSYLVLTPQ